MDTPPWTTLVAAMPGHTRSTFRGARAALNHRFTTVRTPPQLRATHEHVQHSRQEQTAVCDKCASTHNALHNRTPRTLATLQMHQRRQETQVQCSGPPNDDRHDPHTRGGFAPPGPRLSFTGMRASAPTALGRKARFVAPPVSCCGSYIANPVILADLDVGHAAREAWRRDLSKQ